MSNYDWYDDYDPDDQLKRDATARHCGSEHEHKSHVWGIKYKKTEGPRPRPSGLWSTYVGAPYSACPGTVARAEKFKDMLIHFHDGGEVTWTQPTNLQATLEAIYQNRKLARSVEPVPNAEDE